MTDVVLSLLLAGFIFILLKKIVLVIYCIKVPIFTAILVVNKLCKVVYRRRHLDDELDQVSTAVKNGSDFFASDKLGNVFSFRISPTVQHVLLRLADGQMFSSYNNDAVRLVEVDTARTYRIIYCGLLRQRFPDRQDRKFVEVNLRLWYRFLTDPANATIDYDPILLAKHLATQPVANLVDFVFTKEKTEFEQSGELRGVVEFPATGQKHELTMNGLRRGRSITSHVILQGRFENGLIISLSQRPDGYVTYQTGYVYPITWSNFRLSTGDKLPDNMAIDFRAHGRSHHLDVEVLAPSRRHENVIKLHLDNKLLGFGTVSFRDDPVFEHSNKTQTLDMLSPPAVLPFCLQLKDPLCRLESLTGGKSSKLADILAFSSKVHPDGIDFNIPDGFAVTVAAYENHLKMNPYLAQQIKAALEATNEDLEHACQSVKDEFVKDPLTEQLTREIEFQMKTTFGDEDWQTTYVAVRSSAVGEDGAEASGAGQMETFLGRRGLLETVEAIKMCWASHFSPRAIQYRRQFSGKGEVDSSMAVLVQRLVRADSAGVLFTRHPDTGSTSTMVINVCYGIGEGVVSGHVQPDTVSVHRVDDNEENIRISYDNVGEKATSFKVDDKTGSVVEMPENGIQASCCLADSEIRRLYKIGRLLEHVFGSGGRDVEFALVNSALGSNFYILQARPITTADMETDWELLHEFDTPIVSDHEWIMTSNIQEMMPDALSPLSGEIWIAAIKESLEKPQSDIFVKPRRRFDMSKTVIMSWQHLFMNWTMIGSGMTSEYQKLAGDMALFSQKMPQLTTEMFTEQNDMSSKKWQTFKKAVDWIFRFLPTRGISRFTKLVDNFPMPKTDDPRTVFKVIKDSMPLLKDIWNEHAAISASAAMCSMAIMHTMDKTLNWGPQIYEDVSVLLSSCNNVFSAEVPTLLNEIAVLIKADAAFCDAFLSMDRKEAAKWLLSKDSKEIGAKFREFLARHGHRCVRESDLREHSWNDNPEKLVDALKVIITSKAPPPTVNKQKRELSVDEAMTAIKTPLNRTQWFFVRLFASKARTAVGQRECSKSIGIKMIDNYRKLVFLLAKIMTEQSLLPDTDLIFFLTLREIDRLLREKKSPKLIAKALRRRKMLPNFDGLKFSELSKGRPEPVTLAAPQCVKQGNGFSIKGVAVGNGCIEGVARVVKSLADANEIQVGDILIVPYTDVGWTPYFPMISGLVTELGGLISHGAVIAREYGLPCIVGCKQATTLIKTGNKVYINGHDGAIDVIATN